MIKSVLITGATGFVGRTLCVKMLADGWKVRGTFLTAEHAVGLPAEVEAVQTGSIGPDTDWSGILVGVDTVIHLAARVHMMKDNSADPLALFRQVNTAGTERLAKMSAIAGVRRLVYISTIGVNGKVTIENSFTEEDTSNPYNPYTISKWEAEQALQQVSKDTRLESVVLRPPLIYGPCAPGNFARLMRLVKSKLPIPLGCVKNIRSFIYLGNLVDAIVTCLSHTDAAGETFLVSDGQDISTPDLIREIASAMKKTPVLLPFPLSLLNSLGKISGKSDDIERLTGSLSIDSSKIRKMLNWKPPFTLKEGIKETVKWYRSS